MTPAQAPTIQTPPEQQPQQPRLTDDQLLQLLKGEIDSVLGQYIDDESNAEKVLQYMRLRKADFYFRGIQYLAPMVDTNTGRLDYTPVGSPKTGYNGDDAGSNYLDYNLDIIKTYARKFIATLGQRPFYNMRAVPDNPSNEADRQAAREADKVIYLLDSQWNIKTLNLVMAYHLFKSGTVYPYVRWVADGNKYGWTEVPIYEEKETVVDPGGYVCFNCGVKSPELETVDTLDESGAPQTQTVCPSCKEPLDQNSYQEATTALVPADTGRTKRYANGRVEIHFLNGMYVTVPFTAQSMEDVPYLDWQGELPVGQIISLYPQLREKMRRGGDLDISSGGAGNAQTGKLVRASAASQYGIPRQAKNTETVRRVWLRPYQFELIQDEQKREIAKQYFPDGMRVVKVGGETVEIKPEKLDSHFTAVQPEVGDYVFRDGICWGILQHQDAINDTFNQLVEIIERTVTVHLADPEIIDTEAWNSSRNMPMEMIPVKPGTSVNMENGIKTLPQPRFPGEALQILSLVKENVESHTGVLPSIFGAGAPTQTAEQARNQLNQALMQLGTTGEFMIEGWREIHKMGIDEYIRNSPGGDMVGAEVIDIEAIKGGKYHLEGEIGIPRSFAERKDELKALVMQNPQLAQALAVDHPINAGAVRDYLDLPDLEDPTDDARQAVLDLIKKLLEGQAMQQPGPDGAPMDTPSLPFDDLVYDPQQTLDLMRFWAQSPAGRKLEGTPGYQNVMAMMRQIKQILMPPPPPPGAAPAPPDQGAGAPPPRGGGKKPPAPQPTPPSGDQPLPTGAGGPMGQPASQMVA